MNPRASNAYVAHGMDALGAQGRWILRGIERFIPSSKSRKKPYRRATNSRTYSPKLNEWRVSQRAPIDVQTATVIFWI